MDVDKRCSQGNSMLPLLQSAGHRLSSSADSEYFRREDAATRIGRFYLRKRYRQYMVKESFLARLELELTLGIGFWKIVVFCVMFILLFLALDAGSAKANNQLDIRHSIDAWLQLDYFREMSDLEEMRDYLPVISTLLKEYSATRGQTVQEGDTIVIYDRVQFVRSRLLFSWEPTIGGGSFTLAAWVERLPGAEGRVSLLRVPMKSDSSLSCWGWFEPPQLRYGAHDFHTLDNNGSAAEEFVGFGPEMALEPGVVSHEAMIVTETTVTFYRNGVALGEPLALNRPVTECINPATVEAGAAGVALMGVRFYARALPPHQLGELFHEGAPLVEVATGSTLTLVEEEAILQVASEVTEGTEETLAALDASGDQYMMSSKVGLTAEDNRLDIFDFDPNHPFDPSPAAVLPRGEELEVLELLPEAERAAWEAAGRPMSGFKAEAWVEDAILSAVDDDAQGTAGPGSSTRFWSLHEAPVHLDGSEAGRLPELEEATEGVALSLWFKSYVLSRGHGPNVEVLRAGQDGLPDVNLKLQFELDWVWISLEVGGVYVWVWSFLTTFDERTGRISEDFLLYSFAQNPSPLVWRHLLLQYNGGTGKFEFYLDGKQVIDEHHYAVAKYTSWDMPPASRPSARTVFSNVTVTPHSWRAGGKWRSVPGKVAQLRAYPRMLSAGEIERLHKASAWASGQLVRQCSDPGEDFDYADSVEVDGKGHSCAWFASMEVDAPYVCAQSWTRNMCPVTCSGKRLCHDGSIMASWEAPAPRRQFRVFDRIRHIKPIKATSATGSDSVICPSSRVSREQVLRECEAWRAADQRAAEEGGALFNSPLFASNFTRLLERAFALTNPADIRDCTVLAERMDEDQCQWDGSWLDDFQEDYDEVGAWTVSFWAKPTAKSLGMPTNFWFLINLFSTLAPPLILSNWNEIEPKLEPWMDAYTVFRQGSDNGTTHERAAVWPTTLIDYAREWTFFHMQVERMDDDGRHRLCATLNAIPLSCEEVHGRTAFPRGRFLEGIEFTTEMLVSPIEVGTEAMSPSQVQQKYYLRRLEMQKKFGPQEEVVVRQDGNQSSSARRSVSDRKRASGGDERRGRGRRKGGRGTAGSGTSDSGMEAAMLEEVDGPAEGFSKGVMLLAPPILFQTRAAPTTCSSRVTAHVVQAQDRFRQEDDDAEEEDVVMCAGAPATDKYYGQQQQELDGLQGYAKFLYSIADNPIVVDTSDILDQEFLPTRAFLDGATTSVKILALFLEPESGTAVELRAEVDTSGPLLKPHVSFQAFGHVAEDKRQSFIFILTMLFACVAALFFLSLLGMYNARKEAALVGKKANWEMLAGCIFDFCVATAVLAFGIVTARDAMRSEAQAIEILGNLASVPFESSEWSFSQKVSTFFEAINNLHSVLGQKKSLFDVGFAFAVVMLVRIIDLTDIHPRMRILVGTLKNSLSDLMHLSALFLLVFAFFAYTGTWMLGDEHDEYATFATSLWTQFGVLVGGGWTQKQAGDDRLTIFMALSTITQFILMLNFLLAIIVEGYMQVRSEINRHSCERGLFFDIFATLHAWCRGVQGGWPDKILVAHVLRKIRTRNVSVYHLRLQGLPVSSTREMFAYYHSFGLLRSDGVSGEWAYAVQSVLHQQHPTTKHISSVQEQQAEMDRKLARLQSSLDQLLASRPAPLPLNGASPPAASNGTSHTLQVDALNMSAMEAREPRGGSEASSPTGGERMEQRPIPLSMKPPGQRLALNMAASMPKRPPTTPHAPQVISIPGLQDHGEFGRRTSTAEATLTYDEESSRW